METVIIDTHASAGDGTLGREAAESLRANRLDPKLLYVTPRQSELWREVFLKHSPIHGNPEFARIYRDAFQQVSRLMTSTRPWLIGLGCGTGFKESELCRQLKSDEREVLFSAIDVSLELVRESAQKVAAAGANLERSLVCDLVQASFIKEWLHETACDAPRLFTFFGIVPNFKPSEVMRLFREILLPGDLLLVSAHLAPVGESIDLATAMRKVLPQYDNAETLSWLVAALSELGITDKLEAPEMTIGEEEGIPAFVATARWKSGGQPLHLFHSVRYTTELFEEMLRKEFNVELLAITSCREEAIWAVRR